MRVCVVGAGFAGLAAADRLVGAGHEVVVLEARDRVGGRVWSSRLDNGAMVERGAEFVLDGSAELRGYVKRFGLTLSDTGMSYDVREPRGGPPTTVAELEAAAGLISAAAIDASVDQSAAKVLERLPLSEGVREAVAARASISAAWPAEDLAASVLADASSGVQARPIYRVAGGNQSLARLLADGLGPVVSLRSPVTAVRWSEEAAIVATRVGEVEADVVILAVPCAIGTGAGPRPTRPARSLPWRTAFAGRRLRWRRSASKVGPLRGPEPLASCVRSSRSSRLARC